MSTQERLLLELATPYLLRTAQIEAFRENGFIKLQDVFSAQLLDHYRVQISDKVAELSADALPLEQRSTYGRAFLQIMNLWQESEAVREFVFGRRLARIATELMGVRGVRIYHDQALYKEPGGGITPWHADQYYWPVSNDHMITAWVPLQATPLEMGPLIFCEKSHRFQIGRDLEISDKSELTLKEALSHFHQEEEPYATGDVSFHSGWTFHRAGANSTANPRKVMTMIYMDEDMQLTIPKNKNQIADIERWCPSVNVGEVIASSLNPILYSRSGEV